MSQPDYEYKLQVTDLVPMKCVGSTLDPKRTMAIVKFFEMLSKFRIHDISEYLIDSSNFFG